MWRCDAQRTAYTPQELPESLHLQWMRELPEPKGCWPPTQIRLQFDVSYEPVAADGLLFVPSMIRDSVTAYRVKTGEEAWRFYADGPVRFAPVVWNEKVYFASDDGYLYCLNASDGSLKWKFRGGPSGYRVLGNERLISAWPARGAPVLYDGTIYFAASIWPFMGTFFHALDAETGEVVWINSGSGSDYVLQPHSSPAFAGVAPQGYLAATEDILIVPGGRSVPAGYDRHTGRFLYHRADTKDGEYAFFVGGEYVFNQGRMARVSDGGHVRHVDASVIIGDAAIGIDGDGNIRATSLEKEWRDYVNTKGEVEKKEEFPTLWVLKGDSSFGKVFIGAGSRVYVGNTDGLIAAIDVPVGSSASAETNAADSISWAVGIEGKPWTMLAADGRLFVVTEEGRIYCFAGAQTRPVTHARSPARSPRRDDAWTSQAERILETTRVRDGYVAVLGLGTGRLAEELLRQSELTIIGLDPDPEKVDYLRRKFDEMDLYGARIALSVGDVVSVPMAPYFASLVVSEDLNAAGYGKGDEFIQRVFHILRPYGGLACFGVRPAAQAAFIERVESKGQPNAVVKAEGSFVLLERPGPLPGSAPWTHQYADIGNTVCSKDALVKPPLGLLWFGGPSHADVLPRHGHGPCQQVIGGRLFIEGVKVMSARDVYTGRVLWRKELPQLDTFDMYYNKTFNPDPYDRTYNQVHIAGANQYGSNFVATEDRLYLIQGKSLLVIDAANGETIDAWTLPEKDDIGVPHWGYVGVYDDLLIAGVAPYEITKSGDDVVIIPNHRFSVGSRFLVVMDRMTGKVLWEREAEYNFRHNTVVAGRGKVFCIDGMSKHRLDLMRRRGTDFEDQPRILALDLRTGDEMWNDDRNVFGTWLGYSEEYDVLLQAGSQAGDRAGDEAGEGMVAYRGADGAPLWSIDEGYSGPPILHHEKIITQTGGSNTHAGPAKVYHLLTGKRVMDTHPMTGQEIPFEWVRFKGCNTAVAAEHIMTFRSASACYAELANGAGTTSIGGFKSGCTSNLVPADGVLNAPDYTRTCICSYQNQTSLALVHVDEWLPGPAVEGWSFDYFPVPQEPVPLKNVGINFGAPGNRYAADGTLWLEFPSVGGPSPDIPVYVEPSTAKLFRHHMSTFQSGWETQDGTDDESRTNRSWVASSGIEGIHSVIIRPFLQPGNPEDNRKVQGFERHAGTNQLPKERGNPTGGHEIPWNYTVRLHFAEIESLQPGERVFDVFIQDEKVLESFDIVKAAGGAKRPFCREFRGIPVKDDLKVAFRPSTPGNTPLPVLCGIEIHAENR